MLRFVLRRVLLALAVLLLISYVSFFTQDLAIQARLGQAMPPGQVAKQALHDTFQLWRDLAHGKLGTYDARMGHWRVRTPRPLDALLGTLLWNSIGLLLLAMVLGGLVGGLLGALAAAARRRSFSLGLLLLSIVGI
ncbi:MAG: hypothetical protein J7M05_05810, partial [Anaerolineae bacterium]|nr:hypothetical protein [Anaerolineae bacterium]